MPKSTLPPMALGDTVVRQSSGEQATLAVRRLIFEGHLKPGQRVPQYELARALGMSRIPLREALVALEREGWVTLEMHRGAFVNAIDERAVRDNFTLFALIYGFAVEAALSRSGGELVARLSHIEAEIRDEQEPERAAKLMLEFHTTVIDAAQSNRLKVLLRAMSTIVPGNFFEHVPASIEVERKALPAIVKALKQGDGKKAAVEYERMQRRLADEVVKVLRERGLFRES